MVIYLIFFFNDTATTEIYTLSLHDALPICRPRVRGHRDRRLLGGRAGRQLLHRAAGRGAAAVGRGGRRGGHVRRHRPAARAHPPRDPGPAVTPPAGAAPRRGWPGPRVAGGG